MTKNPKLEQLPASPDAVWRLLGLAVRAGRAIAGTEAAIQAVRRQKARLVLLAEDTAENSRQQIVRQCQIAGVPYRQFGTKADLGHWTGHEIRTVAAILDQGFADRMMQLLKTNEIMADQGRQGTE